jgi:hypothetical protein
MRHCVSASLPDLNSFLNIRFVAGKFLRSLIVIQWFLFFFYEVKGKFL